MLFLASMDDKDAAYMGGVFALVRVSSGCRFETVKNGKKHIFCTLLATLCPAPLPKIPGDGLTRLIRARLRSAMALRFGPRLPAVLLRLGAGSVPRAATLPVSSDGLTRLPAVSLPLWLGSVPGYAVRACRLP